MIQAILWINLSFIYFDIREFESIRKQCLSYLSVEEWVSSSSRSSIVTRHNLSRGIFFMHSEFISERTLCVKECYGHSCFILLLRVSFISAPFPSLLNTFPKAFFLFWLCSPAHITYECPLFFWDSWTREYAAQTLESTPTRWDLTTIKFIPIHCEPATWRPFITSFLLELAIMETWGERSLHCCAPLFMRDECPSPCRLCGFS